MNAPTRDLFDNPAGLDGFEFVEFCAPEKGVLEPVFAAMGFTCVANHRSKDVQLWRQGGINLIANYEPRSAAWYFAREHGAAACGMAFRVRDAAKAYAETGVGLDSAPLREAFAAKRAAESKHFVWMYTFIKVCTMDVELETG